MLTETKIQALKAHIAALQTTLGGRFLYYCLPFRKKVVLENMHFVFANYLTPTEIKKLALSFYSHVFTSLQENLMLRFLSQKKIQARAQVRGKEYILDLFAKGAKGVMVLTGHFGNWEFSPIAGMLNFKEFQGRFFFVRKTLGTKFIEKILFKRYYDAGLEVIPKKNSLNTVCETLENGKVVVFVMDQHATLRSKDGIAVEFFGKKAGTFRSLAMIARHMNIPVVPGRSYRQKDGTHVVEFFPALPWLTAENAQDEIYFNTKQYNETLEKFILEHPEQWLWMHRRWKNT